MLPPFRPGHGSTTTVTLRASLISHRAHRDLRESKPSQHTAFCARNSICKVLFLITGSIWFLWWCVNKDAGSSCCGPMALADYVTDFFGRRCNQRDLAQRLGVKQPTIANWERRDAVYRRSNRQRLESVFGADEQSFL